jgi:hypothetical protein
VIAERGLIDLAECLPRAGILHHGHAPGSSIGCIVDPTPPRRISRAPP